MIQSQKHYTNPQPRRLFHIIHFNAVSYLLIAGVSEMRICNDVDRACLDEVSGELNKRQRFYQSDILFQSIAHMT